MDEKQPIEPTQIEIQDPQAVVRMGRFGTLVLGVYLIALGPTMAYALFVLWPVPTPSRETSLSPTLFSTPTPVRTVSTSPTQPSAGSPSPTPISPPSPSPTPTPYPTPLPYLSSFEPAKVSFLWITFTLWDEQRLFLLVLLGGAIGSYLRSTITFASHAEKGEMPQRNWIWWCILQTYIGMLLAAVFYMVQRGTTTSAQAGFQQINIFTTVGIACLVGLFSPQATDKLGAFFDALTIDKKPTFKGSKD